MSIDILIDRFRRLPGARIGHGPRHPKRPEPALSDPVDNFLSDYPFLHADDGYAEFLWKYCGAYIATDDTARMVDIFGFSAVSTNIVEMDGPVVTREGYLIFAQCIYHVFENGKLRDTREHDFAFDTTGERESGIYALFSNMEIFDNEFEWRHASFTAWLADLIDRNGIFEPPVDQ